MIGPLTKKDLELNIDKHQIPEDELANIIASYPKPHAWVLKDVRRLHEPIPYEHPRGAVRWVEVRVIGFDERYVIAE